MARDILDAVYGSIIGGAIGDALGAPVESWYFTEIREKYGHMTELLPGVRGNTGAFYGGSTGEAYNEKYDGPTTPPGTVTDDSALRLYMCLAIVRKGGRITPYDAADIWLEKLNPNRFWFNEKIILNKLKVGMNPWEAGKGTIPAGCATMAIPPIGVINAGNPEQAYQDGYNIAGINADGENRDGAATIAAAVAAAFLPGATARQVIQTMQRYSSYLYKRAIDRALDAACACQSVDEFAEKFYASMLDWTWPNREAQKGRYDSGNSLEIVPLIAALLHLCGDDVNQAMVEGASFGRDCDTLAGLLGCILGAISGASAIRTDWIDTVEQANVDLFQEVHGDSQANFFHMARRMVATLGKEARTSQARVELLNRLLGLL